MVFYTVFVNAAAIQVAKKTTLEKNLAVHFLFYLFTLFIWLRWVSAAARGIFDVAPGLSI